jgi:predicted 3-demethylubiquinone-9 3-methyltransferase (glyoxalase superfamily)
VIQRSCYSEGASATKFGHRASQLVTDRTQHRLGFGCGGLFVPLSPGGALSALKSRGQYGKRSCQPTVAEWGRKYFPKAKQCPRTQFACDDKDAEAAARFYAATFPDSAVGAVHHAPSDYPGGKEGDVLTVEFTVLGIPCLGLNGGPVFKHNEAFSFQIATEDQEETDRYWNAIVGNGGQESQCGWCKDKWGISWQITPRVLTDALAAGGDEAKRAFDAMMGMKKIDIAAIEAARCR